MSLFHFFEDLESNKYPTKVEDLLKFASSFNDLRFTLTKGNYFISKSDSDEERRERFKTKILRETEFFSYTLALAQILSQYNSNLAPTFRSLENYRGRLENLGVNDIEMLYQSYRQEIINQFDRLAKSGSAEAFFAYSQKKQ